MIAPHEGHRIFKLPPEGDGLSKLWRCRVKTGQTPTSSARMISGITLSGQRENVRGVGVVWGSLGRPEGTGSCGKVLERSAARETGIHIVPPLELVTFAQLPTKQDHPAFS